MWLEGYLKTKVSVVVVLLFIIILRVSQNIPEMYSKYSTTSTLKCQQKLIKFSNIIKWNTALASFPGSGNTWTRHLIEQATGIYTSSVYCDKALLPVLRGECTRNGSTIVTKTHQLYKPRFPYDHAIILIRSPLKAIVSWFNFDTVNHTGLANEKTFQDSFKKFVRKHFRRWRRFNESWLKVPGLKKHVVFYDKLMTSTTEEITKLVNFLKVK